MLEVTEKPFFQWDLGFQDGLVLGLRRPAQLLEFNRHC